MSSYHQPFRVLFSSLVFFAASLVYGINFEWIGAGDGNWSDATNWNQVVPPDALDDLLLTAASTAGPITIDLAGPQTINRIDADGVDGTYTFENSGLGALSIFESAGEAVITRDGSSLVFDTDIQLQNAATLRLNVQETGGKITVNGDIASAALAGTTTLMPTAVNTSLPVGVELNGVISDGTAQTALSVGFNSNLSHTGTVRVTGSNTYTGSTRLNIGALEFGSIANVGGGPNALGQPALADSTIRIGTPAAGTADTATLRYLGSGHTSDRVIELAGKDGDTQTIAADGTGALVLTGGISNPANDELLRLGGENTDDNTIAGAIEGVAGADTTSLRKIGNGKWILSGDSPALDGDVVAADGHLVLTGEIGSTISNARIFQVNNAGEFTLDGGYLAAANFNSSPNGTFNFVSGTVRVTSATTSSAFASPLTIGTGGAGTLQLQVGSKVFNDVTLSGADDTLEIAGNGTWQFTNLDNSAGGTLNASGALVQINGGTFTQRVDAGTSDISSRVAGSGGFTKQGDGTLEFTFGTQHTYTGPTRIEGGRLRLVAGAGLPDISPLFIAAGAELDLVGATGGDAFGPLTGAGTIVTAEGMGPAILTNGQNADFGGSIVGAGGLIKQQSGRQTLSGANTYTGATTLESNAGTLEVSDGGSIVGTSGITYSSATLSVTGGTIDTPGNIRPLANNALLNFTGGLIKANAIDRTVNSAYLSDFVWTGGTLHLLSATVINGSSITAINRPFAGPATLNSGMAFIVDDTLSVTNAGVLNINGGSVTADTIVTGGTINFNSGTIRMRNSQVLDAARLSALDAQTPLVASQTLVIDGTATIQAPLVLAGGTFSAGAIENLENIILSSGTLEVTGSDLEVATGAVVDATSGMTVNVTNGALNVAAGGQFNAINATLDFSNGVNNSGDINLISTTVNGSLINGAGGAVALVGSNTFGDDITLSADSTLFVDIAGTAPGEFDVLSVGGDATLAGDLVVSFTNGFMPTIGDTFDIVKVDGISSGAFAGLADGALVGSFGGVDLFIDYAPSGVTLFTEAGADADFDNDGDVDGADFLAIQRSNPELLGAWEAQYGAGSSIQASAQSVPEPTTVMLATFAGLLMIGRVRMGRAI